MNVMIFPVCNVRFRGVTGAAIAMLLLILVGDANAQSAVQGVPNAMQGFSQNRDQPIQIGLRHRHSIDNRNGIARDGLIIAATGGRDEHDEGNEGSNDNAGGLHERRHSLVGVAETRR